MKKLTWLDINSSKTLFHLKENQHISLMTSKNNLLKNSKKILKEEINRIMKDSIIKAVLGEIKVSTVEIKASMAETKDLMVEIKDLEVIRALEETKVSMAEIKVLMVEIKDLEVIKGLVEIKDLMVEIRVLVETKGLAEIKVKEVLEIKAEIHMVQIHIKDCQILITMVLTTINQPT